MIAQSKTNAAASSNSYDDVVFLTYISTKKRNEATENLFILLDFFLS